MGIFEFWIPRFSQLVNKITLYLLDFEKNEYPVNVIEYRFGILLDNPVVLCLSVVNLYEMSIFIVISNIDFFSLDLYGLIMYICKFPNSSVETVVFCCT